MNTSHYLYALLLPLLNASAGTPAEDTMNKAQMPHATLTGGGPTVRVHLARAQGYFESEPDHKAHMADLRKTVQDCVIRHRRNGIAVNPPSTWPDYVMSMRKDEYAATNRAITYMRSIAYFVNQSDCSLTEVVSSGAKLVSNSGTCRIDLVEKTASGLCDPQGHATAAPPARSPPPSAAQMAALEKAMGKDAIKRIADAIATPRRKKNVLGVTCEIFKTFEQTDLRENMCFVFGVPSSVSSGPHTGVLPAIVLEERSRHGYNLDAIEARLDESVNPAVFTPYLAGGFTIKQAAR